MKHLFIIIAFSAMGLSLLSGEEKTPTGVSFVISVESGWFFTVKSNGAIYGQFGGLLGDYIQLPPGTANFNEIVKLVTASHVPLKKESIQAGVLRAGKRSFRMKYIEDSGYFQKLFLKHRKNWLGWNKKAPNERMMGLMKNIEYYQKPNKMLR